MSKESQKVIEDIEAKQRNLRPPKAEPRQQTDEEFVRLYVDGRKEWF